MCRLRENCKKTAQSDDLRYKYLTCLSTHSWIQEMSLLYLAHSSQLSRILDDRYQSDVEMRQLYYNHQFSTTSTIKALKFIQLY